MLIIMRFRLGAVRVVGCIDPTRIPLERNDQQQGQKMAVLQYLVVVGNQGDLKR
jgi:hypothetical protein